MGPRHDLILLPSDKFKLWLDGLPVFCQKCYADEETIERRLCDSRSVRIEIQSRSEQSILRGTTMDLAEAQALPREGMEFDVVIVGAGPAGLAAAIRLKQKNPDLAVVVVEKGSEVGAHILSGAVIDPIGLDRLLPDWREDDQAPIKTAVTDDHFLVLGPAGGIRLPNFLMPPLMSNHGNYIVSLGNVCRWLATKAEALGVEIYPGFAAAEVLYGEKGEVIGVATGDMGIAKDNSVKDGFTRGMELKAKYTLFAEGARGHLTKTLIKNFRLDEDRELVAEVVSQRVRGATGSEQRVKRRPRHLVNVLPLAA